MNNIETITLQIKKSRIPSVLQYLRKLNYVKIETRVDIVNRYFTNAPTDVPLTEKNIIDEMMQSRWQKKSNLIS